MASDPQNDPFLSHQGAPRRSTTPTSWTAGDAAAMARAQRAEVKPPPGDPFSTHQPVRQAEPAKQGPTQSDLNDPFLSHQGAPGRSARTVQRAEPTAAEPQALGTGGVSGPDGGGDQSVGVHAPARSALILIPILKYAAVAFSLTIFWDLVKVVPVTVIVLCTIIAPSYDKLRMHRPGHKNPWRYMCKLHGYHGPVGYHGWVATQVGLLAVLLGLCTGVYAREAYMHPYYTIALQAEYKDVLASSPGAAYADAGKITFASSSQVDSGSSVGFQDRSTYCVAPIVDSGLRQTPRVSFWAIGYDCCEAKGDFWCGSGGDPAAGVRVPPDTALVKERQKFRQAAKQAAATNNLQLGNDLVFLHWVESPTAVQLAMVVKALGICLLGTALYALLDVALYVAASSLVSKMPVD